MFLLLILNKFNQYSNNQWVLNLIIRINCMHINFITSCNTINMLIMWYLQNMSSLIICIIIIQVHLYQFSYRSLFKFNNNYLSPSYISSFPLLCYLYIHGRIQKEKVLGITVCPPQARNVSIINYSWGVW